MKKTILSLLLLAACATMFAQEPPTGALIGKFSVSAGQQVHFSKGNLQYQASTQTYQFATNQYDTIGIGNANIADDYAGWIDLFGWGTGDAPTKASTNKNDYTDFVDWGTNKISNGGNEANMWRTLTRDEWDYMYNTRENATSLRGQATINGIQGYILLPDNWELPDGLNFTPTPNSYSSNSYTLEQWETLESAGAVFLPAAGWRNGTTVSWSNERGYYWASTKATDGPALIGIYSSKSSCGLSWNWGYYGKAVRLVTKEIVPTYQVTITLPEHGTITQVETIDLTAVESGTVLHFTAKPDPGYEFDSWVNYDPATGLVVTQDTTITCSFKVETPAPEIRLTGVFSVGESTRVLFAQGNVQYKASTQTWRFAAHQYDAVGADNSQISYTSEYWIDLFGWGTGSNPWSTSYNTVFVDWGSNPISNGGNEANMWRTLTRDEWDYLYNTRENATSLRGQATINGIKGYILLPDNWELPDGLSFTSTPSSYSTNTYTLEQWETLESAGAVFLPAAGWRDGTTVSYSNERGLYWASTKATDGPAAVSINDNKASCGLSWSYGQTGLSVRLVREANYHKVTLTQPENGKIVPTEDVDLNNVEDGSVIHFTVMTKDSLEVDEWINYNPETGLVVTGDTTISCTLKVKTYEVTFVDWDDSVLKEDIVEWGHAAEAPADPVRLGYTFTGWDKDFSSVKSDLTVKAKYSQDFYDVSVIVENGSVNAYDTLGHGISLSNHFHYGYVLILSAEPDEGYEFDGWENYNPEVELIITSDTTITCHFAKQTFEVVFVDWDDSVLKDAQIVEWGDGAEAPADPVRLGYTFTGWDTDFSSVKSNLTVKAEYSQNFYDVSVITENGSVKATDTLGHDIDLSDHFAYGYVLILSAEPDEGYEFDGWENYDPEVGLIITGDTTITCHFAKQTFEVVFVDWDDSVLKDAQIVEWGDGAEAPADPEREGYTFTGWDTDFSSVKSNLTVKAQYEIIEGVESVQGDKIQCTKILRNGQLFIEKNGKTYTVQGAEVK